MRHPAAVPALADQQGEAAAQVWTNCALYNPPNTPVRVMGDRLTETWEKKWYQSGIEARWKGLLRELTEEEVRQLPAMKHGFLRLHIQIRQIFEMPTKMSSVWESHSDGMPFITLRLIGIIIA